MGITFTSQDFCPLEEFAFQHWCDRGGRRLHARVGPGARIRGALYSRGQTEFDGAVEGRISREATLGEAQESQAGLRLPPLL